MKALGFLLSLLAFFQFTFGSFLDSVVVEYDRPAQVIGPNMNTLGGGGIRYRWPSQSVALFSITPPSLKMGCSGIDLSLGSLGLMNFDEFGRLLESLMGPAGVMFAFNLALSALCPQCQQILDQLASLANQLNQMQLDQCQLVKAAGTWGKVLGKQIADELGTNDDAFNILLKRATESVGSLREKIQSYLDAHCLDPRDPNNKYKCGLGLMYNGGCLMDVVARDLSFLGNLTGNQDLIALIGEMGGGPERLAKIFRYYFGDICFPKTDGLSGLAGMPTEGVYIPPRAKGISDFIQGFLGYSVRNSGNNQNSGDFCQNGQFILRGLPVRYEGGNPKTEREEEIQINRTVCAHAKREVDGIIRAIQGRRPLSPDQIQLLSSLPMPIYKLLNYGSVYPGFLESIADKLHRYMMVELSIAIIARLSGEMISIASTYQAGLTTEDNDQTNASEIIERILRDTVDLRKELERYRMEYVRQLREAIHSYELADKLYNSMLAQMAYSPLYGNLVFSKLIGVRF